MSSRKYALKQKERAKMKSGFRPIPLSSRAGHKSPHMKRPRLNRTENNKEDTEEECDLDHLQSIVAEASRRARFCCPF